MCELKIFRHKIILKERLQKKRQKRVIFCV